tara:strand:- start:67 stop:474 length:408 start_codon:yes stop_codon:yes gene_type:complete
VFFEDQKEKLEAIIAKSADLTNRPFLHSVVKITGEYDFNDLDFDVTVNILCRDIDGKRLDLYDLELELFRSNRDLVLVISKLNFPQEPILWSGVKTLWMNSNNGKKCNPPNYSSTLENLANRIKNYLEESGFYIS